jgi:hypothetical protein
MSHTRTRPFDQSGGPLSNTLDRDVTFNYDSNGSPLFREIGIDKYYPAIDYNGDGYNDFVFRGRDGVKIVDFKTGEILLHLNDVGDYYSPLGAMDVDGDGKVEFIVQRISPEGERTTFVYATNGPALESVATGLRGSANAFQLRQNYPNPFNPSTTISYEIPKASDVNITIYDLNGRAVREIVDGHEERGSHSVVWDGKDASGRNVASGSYFCQVHSGDFVQAKKMVMVR